MMNLKSPTSGNISVDQLAIGEDGPGVGERYFIFVCAFLLIAIIDKLAVLYFDWEWLEKLKYKEEIGKYGREEKEF